MDKQIHKPEKKKGQWFKWYAAWDSVELTASERSVLLALQRYLSGNTIAWPSIERLAKFAAVSNRTASRSLERLSEVGIINKLKLTGGTCNRNVYELNPNFEPSGYVTVTEPVMPNNLEGGEDQDDPVMPQLPNRLGHDFRTGSETVTEPSVYKYYLNLITKYNQLKEELRGYRNSSLGGSDKQTDPSPDFASVNLANREPQKQPELDDWGYPIEPTSPEPQPTAIVLKTPETGQGLTITPSDESLVVPEKKIKPRPRKPPNPEDHQTTPGGEVWNEYAAQFERKYGVPPVRPSAKERSHCKQLVDALGKEQAIHLVAYYVQTNHRYFVEKCHPIGLAVSDRHRLMTELATGKRSFRFDAEQAEKAQRLEQLGNIDWDEIESPFATEEENNARLERLAAKKNAARSNLLR